MVIPEGYKKTEIGIIPEDWSVVPFEKAFSVLHNNTLSRAELNCYNGDIQNIHYGDVLIKYPFILDCSKEKIPYINDDRTFTASKGFLQDGDIIISDTAEDEVVGKATEIIGVNGRKVVSGLHTIPCRAKNINTFALRWLGYYINSRFFHDQIIPYITGIKVSSISKISLFKTLVAYPRKSEQERIVAALSDIDILIDNLEKLISKKKNIKQGAMQELLTGKRRLPGFDGEWIKKPLKEVGRIVVGSTPSRERKDYWGGTICWISSQDFKQKYIEKSVEKITDLGSTKCSLLPEGAVLATCVASIGLNAIALVECATNQQIYAIVCSNEYSNELIYYHICNEKNNMKRLAALTAVPIINKTQFESYEIFIPKTKDEQIAIASVLSDMDSEIYELKKKLVKYRNIKKGMMSELLTGHIRLTDKEGNNGQSR